MNILNIPDLKITDLDKQIWEEELASFVPKKIYDIHTHIYQWKFNLDNKKELGPYQYQGKYFPEVSMEAANLVDKIMMPARKVSRLSFPFPYNYPCDFDSSNNYLASEVLKNTGSFGLILINPNMKGNEIEKTIIKSNAIGFKPYRVYSKTGDSVNARITDFMPEHQIKIAEKYGLIIMMHLSKKDAIADNENISDMVRLSGKYPNVKWILAHCARSYSAWAIEKAAKKLRSLPNVWYDCSTVCESDALDALYTGVGVDKIMYGSDDMIGPMRGKYIAFGKAWTALTPSNHSLKLTHCDDRMTFIRYEQLRAMKRGARQIGLNTKQKKALFHDTAYNLVNSVNIKNK
jgi:glutamate-1-semialdehyde 2,1-aminomutase